MGEFARKNKKWIAVAVIAAVLVVAAVFMVRKTTNTNKAEEDTQYSEGAELIGENASLGMVNRFAGVVESQGTWSVNKNSSVDVEELYVQEGEEVEEGQVLFIYSTDKYEEDLRQAQIDLERLHNEYQSTEETIAQLEKEKKNASSSEQANYTVQIKEQSLALKDKNLDIQMKEMEIEKLEDNIENAEVKSGISGVVKSINEGGSSSSSSDNSYITVMKVGTFRVKGTVNEQNIGDLYVGAPVIVHSRVNDNVWKGTITKIDTENAVTTDSNSFGLSDSGSKSSSYPFYVELEDSSGLIMGQHVYVEVERDQVTDTMTEYAPEEILPGESGEESSEEALPGESGEESSEEALPGESGEESSEEAQPGESGENLPEKSVPGGIIPEGGTAAEPAGGVG